MVHSKKQHKVYADMFSLETILTNLIDNGLFYSPPESTLHIRLTTIEQGTNRLMVTIENMLSTALTEENIQHLCKPMYQADPSRSQHDRHGLGLAIVDNLCRANKLEWTIRLIDHNHIRVSVLIPLVSYDEEVFTR